jgi:hypothetical protein
VPIADKSMMRDSPHCRRWRRGTTCVLVAFIFTMLQTATSLSMKYQPPVKSSVSTLYGGRRSRQPPSSNPRKSAYSGTLSMPPFEQRMRDMVLKEPNNSLTASSRRRTALPKNVCEVESLQEYKGVIVGNPKIVVVRFHASYCQVSLVASRCTLR